MGNTPIPIIQLEIRHLKHSMAVALSEYVMSFDEMLQDSLHNYCTPENLRAVIEQETRRTLDIVIKEEVRKWYTTGDGREVIKKAVEQKLKDNMTWTPLDD